MLSSLSEQRSMTSSLSELKSIMSILLASMCRIFLVTN
uniref:Uncharacterized protein n=1 Tax=Arundo donax TaxID=35708 RepID=A0A0A8YKN3_ARUDO